MPLTYRHQQLSGWGRYPKSYAGIARPERSFEIAEALHQIRGGSAQIIARGAGKAYGDAALNAGGLVLSMTCLNRFLAFDRERGHLTCEAGVTLREVLEVCVPHGWSLAVTPGTASVTVGGCLACDVHGKNHHLVGSFSQHVECATVLTGDGETRTCGPDREADLFWATAGGMGLTGIILDVTLRLQRIETAFILTRNRVTRDLEDTFRQIEDSEAATYSVAWLDGVWRGRKVGRGAILLGEPARTADLPVQRRGAPLALSSVRAKSLPFGLPSVLLCRPVALAFNEMVYRRFAASSSPSLVDMRRYMYPLDGLDNWNRAYGRRGFLEYQVVLPPTSAFDGVRRMLDMLHRAETVSFFTSLKRLGEAAPGHISFPMSGYAFSFDVPAGDKAIMTLLDRCDEITLAAGGRVYLAKDARLTAEKFAAMYPRHNEWRRIAHHYGPAGLFASDLGRRLGLGP